MFQPAQCTETNPAMDRLEALLGLHWSKGTVGRRAVPTGGWLVMIYDSVWNGPHPTEFEGEPITWLIGVGKAKAQTA